MADVLTGIDASRHQGAVNWRAVRNAGHDFAIIKATEGTSYGYTDWYQDNAPRVKAAGLVPGAYHFLRADRDVVGQARYFAQIVGSFAGVLAVVDVETAANGTEPQINHVRGFATEFARLVPGHRLLVYTGRWYWVGHMGDPRGVDIGPLWHSRYASTPGQLYGGWDHATIWQWTSSGSCPGVAGDCDMNRYDGTRADLLKLAASTITEDDVLDATDKTWIETTLRQVVLDADQDGGVRRELRRLFGALTMGVSNPAYPMGAGAPYEGATTLPKVLTAVAQIEGADVDEATVAAAVLQVLTPEAIAAAIPEANAESVANLLASRLAS